ncbi:MAG: Ppx/GppA family phosphatase, partial [Epsilonproteobacteria bacterium]|nr:Ppx/GppA family phosphatase [Campylobacterota bacterium]
TDILDADEKQLTKLGIKKDRFDIIKPGALILDRILKKLPIKKVITSGVGVREGVFLSDLLRNSKDRFPTHYNTSVRYIIDTHISQKDFSNQLNSLTKKIFDLTHTYLGIETHYRRELAISAKLYPSGNNIHFFSKNKHTYYILQSALEYGFTHKQITLISTLCKYAKKKLPSNSHIKKYETLLPDTKTLNALSYILSLAIALLTHRPRNIDFKIKFEDEILKIDSKETLRISKESVDKLESLKALKVTF